jgi:hypothetical protein
VREVGGFWGDGLGTVIVVSRRGVRFRTGREAGGVDVRPISGRRLDAKRPEDDPA